MENNMNKYSDIVSDGGMDPRNEYEKEREYHKMNETKNNDDEVAALLHSTTDAQVWTDEFIKTFNKLYPDAYYNSTLPYVTFKDWIHVWFCNAIQTGIDLTHNERCKRYVYILQGNSGAIVNVWNNGFEPSEDEMDKAYNEHCGTSTKNSASFGCTLYRWNKYDGLKCWNGKASAETIYNWK